jgi:hypothetical protein
LRDHAAKPLDFPGAAALKGAYDLPHSSGSRRVESALEPAMSQNIMVSWRRSGMPIGSARELQAPTSTQPPSWRRNSRRIQGKKNFALGGLSLPQAGHLRDRAEPHSVQNLAACGTGALQFGHSTSVPHTNGLHTLARISHTKKCIGAPNQRKFFYEKDFPKIRGRPDDDRL